VPTARLFDVAHSLALFLRLVVVPQGGPWGSYYNTKPQVEALETLLRKLPDPATPAPPPIDRPKPGRARQLDANQVQELIAGYQAGATVYELGDRFGIFRRSAGSVQYRVAW
jgi:hypothetical protein